jgi:hypothetical protein
MRTWCCSLPIVSSGGAARAPVFRPCNGTTPLFEQGKLMTRKNDADAARSESDPLDSLLDCIARLMARRWARERRMEHLQPGPEDTSQRPDDDRGTPDAENQCREEETL